MTILRNDKAKILRAYLEKLITKDQMEVLLNEGSIVPPIPWIFSSEEEQQKDIEKRELIGKILGVSYSKIDWI